MKGLLLQITAGFNTQHQTDIVDTLTGQEHRVRTLHPCPDVIPYLSELLRRRGRLPELAEARIDEGVREDVHVVRHGNKKDVYCVQSLRIAERRSLQIGRAL